MSFFACQFCVFWIASKTAQEAPKRPQDPPKSAPRGSKRPQEHPRRPQKQPKRPQEPVKRVKDPRRSTLKPPQHTRDLDQHYRQDNCAYQCCRHRRDRYKPKTLHPRRSSEWSGGRRCSPLGEAIRRHPKGRSVSKWISKSSSNSLNSKESSQGPRIPPGA